MLISRNISIATAAALGLAAAPAAALAAGGAEVVDSADAFAAEAEADAAESRLADLVPTGGLQARWRVRAPSAGSQRWYQRLDWQPATGWAAHLLVERDPGEARWNDYTSAYLDWRGRRGSVTVGDLRPGFGQGLVFGRSGARGGASRPGPRGDRTCAGYRSTAESGAVRGVLVALHRGPATLALLASALAWDGRIAADGRITSLLEAGTHATASERAARDRVRGRALGASLRWRGARGSGGLQVLQVDLARRLDLRRAGKVARAFCGRTQRLVSADVRWGRRRSLAYAEAAVDAAGRAAAVGGLRLRARGVRAAAAAFRYPPEWHSFLGGAASSSGMVNEEGLAFEVAGKGWRAYVSQHRRLQSAYTAPLPRPAHTWGLEAKTRLGAVWRGAAAARLRPAGEGGLGEPTAGADGQLRLDLERRTPAQRWRLRWEVRSAGSGSGRERGAMGSVSWRWREGGAEVTLHGTAFCTASYAARLYEYEAELPGAVSILPLYGRGWRAYGLARWQWRAWTCGLRCRHLRARGRGGVSEAAVQVDLAVGG